MAKKKRSDAQQDQARDEKHRVEGFHALLASDKKGNYFLEDMDGDYRQWPDLSPAGKLSHIASDAAYYDVPFGRFAEAAQDVLRDQPPAAREEAALQLLYRHQRERHALGKLLPDDDRTEPYPLVECLQDTLDWYDKRLKELAPHEKLVTALKQFVADEARAASKEKPDQPPTRDVFERNGHSSAKNPQPKSREASTRGKEPKPDRQR
jgi:hypothetical protein